MRESAGWFEGGQTGAVGASGGDHFGEGGVETMTENLAVSPHTTGNASLRVPVLLYGAGLSLWSLVVLFALRGSLV